MMHTGRTAAVHVRGRGMLTQSTQNVMCYGLLPFRSGLGWMLCAGQILASLLTATRMPSVSLVLRVWWFALQSVGRRSLAIKLLEEEPSAAQQVPLLISLSKGASTTSSGGRSPDADAALAGSEGAEDTLSRALRKAVDARDPDLVYLALFAAYRSRPLPEFWKMVAPRPTARNLFVKYTRVKVCAAAQGRQFLLHHSSVAGLLRRQSRHLNLCVSCGLHRPVALSVASHCLRPDCSELGAPASAFAPCQGGTSVVLKGSVWLLCRSRSCWRHCM